MSILTVVVSSRGACRDVSLDLELTAGEEVTRGKDGSTALGQSHNSNCKEKHNMYHITESWI